jgi:imidazolonepropionase-like amidohydrolase
MHELADHRALPVIQASQPALVQPESGNDAAGAGRPFSGIAPTSLDITLRGPLMTAKRSAFPRESLQHTGRSRAQLGTGKRMGEAALDEAWSALRERIRRLALARRRSSLRGSRKVHQQTDERFAEVREVFLPRSQIFSGVAVVVVVLLLQGVGSPLTVSGQEPTLLLSAVTAPDTTAFVGVSVVSMTGTGVLTGQTVLVRGSAIVAIGPAAVVTVPPNACRIDGQGKFLLPGFGNMHVHLETGEPIDDVPSSVAIERLLLLYLSDGVTTVRNMNGRPWHLTLRDEIARGRRLGPTVYTSGPALGTDIPLPSPEAGRLAVRTQQAAGYDFLKIYDGFSAETFDAVMAEARRLGIRVAGHASKAPGLERTLSSGLSSIEHLTGYFNWTQEGFRDSSIAGDPFVAGPADPARLRAMAEATAQARVWNTPTLQAHRRVVKSPMAGDLVKALADADAGLLLGTDGSPLHRLRITGELEAFVEAGLTPYQAMRTATHNVAAFLGMLNQTGTVEVGKRADLVLLTGNPLADVRHTARPAGVMVGGRWVSGAALDARLAALEASRMRAPADVESPSRVLCESCSCCCRAR